MAEHNGLDGKLMTVGEAVERFVHDGDQVCVGGFTINRNPMAVDLRDRPPPRQGPAPGGALQRPGARRARRRRLRAPPRHRLRRQRPLRPDLHPLPQGGRARRGAGRGLHQQHDEPALPRRRAERPVHPQQVGAGDGRRREERLPARAPRRGRHPLREGHRHRRPLRPRGRRGRPPPRAHARRLRSSTPSR